VRNLYGEGNDEIVIAKRSEGSAVMNLAKQQIPRAAKGRFGMTIHGACCAWLILLLALLCGGCHSRGVNVSIQNNTKVTLLNVEVDYPGASFGTGSIPPNGSFWYRVKPTGDGQLTLSFDLQNGASCKEKGPGLHRGQEGDIILFVLPDAIGKCKRR